MTTILSLGVSKEILQALTKCLKLTVHEAGCFEEAFKLLEDIEFTTIVCDSHTCPIDIDTIECFLARTPPTTRIILLATASDSLNQDQLAGLGVTTFLAPIAVHELAHALSH